MLVLCIVFLEERESEEKLRAMKNGLVFTFPFLYASYAEKPNLSSPIKTKASEILFSAETGLSETLL